MTARHEATRASQRSMKLFFARAVLRDGERAALGLSLSPSISSGSTRDIFELIGRDIDGAAERFERGAIVVNAARVKSAATSAAGGCSCGSKMWQR